MRESALRRHDPSVGMGDDSAAAQLDQKVMGTIKRFHLDIDAANLPKGMGIGAGARRHAEGAAQFLGSPVELGPRPPVEDLHDVDLSGDPLDRLFPEIAPASVVGVFEIDQASLLLDSLDRSLWGQTARNHLLEEEADQLAFSRQDLLADDRGLAGLDERLGAADPLMVSKEDGGETQLAAPAGNLEWRYQAVKRGGTVKVEIDPNPGKLPPPLGERRVGAFGHVGYYRREEGSGKGSRKVRASEGWQLTGKDRLSFRNKSALWN